MACYALLNAFSRTGNAKTFGRYFHSLTAQFSYTSTVSYSKPLFSTQKMRNAYLDKQNQLQSLHQTAILTMCLKKSYSVFKLMVSDEYREQNKREGEIHKLSAALGSRKNTIFSTIFIDEHACNTKLTLREMVTYCLLREYGGRVFEFLDGDDEDDFGNEGPNLHYRSTYNVSG